MRHTMPWTLLVLVASVASASAAPRVAIEGEPGRVADVRERVERELGVVRWTSTSSAVDLRFVIAGDDPEWSVDLYERDDVIDTRRVDAKDREAALRVVALVVVDAIDRWVPPPPLPPVRRWLFLEVAAEVLSWTQPFTPQLGASIAARVRAGPVWVGVRGGAQRWCCGIGSEGIEADALTLSALAEVSLPLGRLAFAELGLDGGIGVARDRVEAVAIFPGGRGPPDVSTHLAPAGRAVAWARIGDAVGLTISAGVWLQGASETVRLPSPYDVTASPLRRGVVAPYLAVAGFLSM